MLTCLCDNSARFEKNKLAYFSNIKFQNFSFTRSFAFWDCEGLTFCLHCTWRTNKISLNTYSSVMSSSTLADLTRHTRCWSSGAAEVFLMHRTASGQLTEEGKNILRIGEPLINCPHFIEPAVCMISASEESPN